MNPSIYTTPTFQAAGGLNAQSNGTTPATPVLPAGVANDIIIVLAFAQNSNTDFTVPAGYTAITQMNVGAHKFAAFWKRHTGTESNPSIANPGWTSTNIMAAKADIYRGCITTGTPYEALATNASASGAILGAPVVTTGVKRLAVNLFGRLANTASATDLVWTERYDAGTAGGGGCRFYVDTREQVWPGTVPASSRTVTAAFGAMGFALIGDGIDYTPPARTMHKGLWVWDSITVLGNQSQENILLNECVSSGITDLYLYTFSTELTANADKFRSFIRKCTHLGIKCWGLDGSRTYFADLDGEQQLIDDVAAIVAFNNGSVASQRLYGFHIDVEPNDSGLGLAFHNGIASSALSSTPGSGVWQNTQVLDREFLMRDWVKIHQDMKALCDADGLELSTAIPTWVDDYFGEPVTCTYNAVTQNVFLHIAGYAHSIAMMSYSTTPATVISRILYEFEHLDYAASVKVGFALETATGVGSGISYGDTVGKQTKAAMLADYQITHNLYAGNPSYTWFNIHDWAGYKALSPASSNSTAVIPESNTFFTAA